MPIAKQRVCSSPEKHTVIMTAKSWNSHVYLFILNCGLESQFCNVDRSLNFSGMVTTCHMSTEGGPVCEGDALLLRLSVGNGGLWSSDRHWRCERTVFIF